MMVSAVVATATNDDDIKASHRLDTIYLQHISQQDHDPEQEHQKEHLHEEREKNGDDKHCEKKN